MVKAKLLKMTEPQLQVCILDLAKYLGLLTHHCRPAIMRSGKWATPIQGNAGFPDLCIAGVGGVVFAELKGDTTQPTDAQMRWLGTLEAAGAEAYLWRPAHWDDGTIREVLARLAKPKAVA
jgi:hypothetical protein